MGGSYCYPNHRTLFIICVYAYELCHNSKTMQKSRIVCISCLLKFEENLHKECGHKLMDKPYPTQEDREDVSPCEEQFSICIPSQHQPEDLLTVVSLGHQIFFSEQQPWDADQEFAFQWKLNIKGKEAIFALVLMTADLQLSESQKASMTIPSHPIPKGNNSTADGF